MRVIPLRDVAEVSERSDDLVAAMGIDTGISKSEVSRICAGLDERVDAFRNRTLGHVAFPYVYLDATYINVRDDALGQVVSRAVVIATGITACAYTDTRKAPGTAYYTVAAVCDGKETPYSAEVSTADADAGLVAGALTANRSRSSTVSVSLSPAPPQSVTALTRSVSAIRTLASSNPRLCASTSPRWW